MEGAQVSIEVTIGAACTWVATWLAKRFLKDSLEAVWVPRVALGFSVLGTVLYKGISSGLTPKVALLGAVQGVVQALLATGTHEGAAPLIEKPKDPKP